MTRHKVAFREARDDACRVAAPMVLSLLVPPPDEVPAATLPRPATVVPPPRMGRARLPRLGRLPGGERRPARPHRRLVAGAA